jgi:saccharopine dehydrogenase-like NADP-dependent oxidoreductase
MNGLILVAGGYGVVGSRIVADLAADFPGQVVVAGRHLDHAQATAAAAGNGVQARRIDVHAADELTAALGDVAVVVNCIDQPQRGLMWAAIERGLAFTDITPHLTALGRDAAYEQIGTAARASGARLVLGTGMVPGISSMMVRALKDAIGGADAIETSLLLNANDLTGPGSFDYLLQELTMAFQVFVDGADRPARPFTSPRTVVFPTPIGPRPAYLFPFSDQVLYPRTLGAQTVTTRLAIDPPTMSRLLSILVATGAPRVLSRPRVRAALGKLRQRRARPESVAPYALRVEVRRGEEIGISSLTGRGQADATAIGAAAVVRALARDEVSQAGAWMPEQVIDHKRFFDRLATRGLSIVNSVNGR